MRFGLVLCLVFVGVAGSAGAAGTASPAAVTTLSEVRGLAADGDLAAAVVAGPPAHAFVWSASTGRVTQLESALCGSCTPRSSVFGIALTGGRAAWVVSGGGNTYETSVLTATTRSPKAVPLGYGVAVDGAAGTFAGNVRADGGVIVFDVYDRCGDTYSSLPCPADWNPGSIDHAEIWRFSAGGVGLCPTPLTTSHGCRRLAAADGDLSILAFAGGRIAARTQSGAVRLLSATSGATLAEFPYAPGLVRAAALDVRNLVVLRNGFLDLYSIGAALPPRTLRLPLVAMYGPANPPPDAASASPPTRVPKLTLEDVDSGFAVYVVDRCVHLVRISDGKDVVVAVAASGPAHAQLEPSGLFVSSTRRITFMPMADVRRIFANRQ
jgi:hypothetical protein